MFEVPPYAGVRKYLTVDAVTHGAPVRPDVDEREAMRLR